MTDWEIGLAAGVFVSCVLYAVWPFIPEKVGEAALAIGFIATMFFIFQVATCWYIWQLMANSGYTPDQGPLECAVETIKGHFE